MPPSQCSARVASRSRGRGVRLALAAGLAACALASCAGAASLAGCGGSSAAAPTVSAAPAVPTAVPSPQITGGTPPAAAVDAVRAFWTLAGGGRLAEAQRTLVAPGSPILRWTGEDIASARFVRVVPHSVGAGPLEAATIEFAAVVWIEPARDPNVWGEPGEHQLFEQVTRMSDGTWRIYESGTGP